MRCSISAPWCRTRGRPSVTESNVVAWHAGLFAHRLSLPKSPADGRFLCVTLRAMASVSKSCLVCWSRTERSCARQSHATALCGSVRFLRMTRNPQRHRRRLGWAEERFRWRYRDREVARLDAGRNAAPPLQPVTPAAMQGPLDVGRSAERRHVGEANTPPLRGSSPSACKQVGRISPPRSGAMTRQ